MWLPSAHAYNCRDAEQLAQLKFLAVLKHARECASHICAAVPAADAAAAAIPFAATGNSAVLQGIQRLETSGLPSEDGGPPPTQQQRQSGKLQVDLGHVYSHKASSACWILWWNAAAAPIAC